MAIPNTWAQVDPDRKPKQLRDGMGHGKADLKRQHMPRVQSIMGAAKRSPITGEISLQDIYDIPDFFIVDLLQRDGLPAKIQDLSDDPYLFKPVPLSYRTWFYHSLWKQKKLGTQKVSGAAKYEHETLLSIFGIRALDVPISAGRHSPMTLYAAGAFCTAMAGYGYLTMVMLGVMILLYAASVGTNSPASYTNTRLVTLPVRMAFLGWVLMTFKTDTPMLIAGYAVAAAVPLIDIMFGDLEIFRNFKYRCAYEVLRIMPNRVYICQRMGGEFVDEVFGYRGHVQECICGFRNWTSRHMLIADISGLLCELRPMSPEDWCRVSQEWSAGGGLPMPYIGLDTFVEDESGHILPNGIVKDLAKDMGFDTWAKLTPGSRQGRPSQDLVLEGVDG